MKLPVVGIASFSIAFCMVARAADCTPDCPCITSTPRLLDVQELPIQVEPAALQRQYDALQAMRLDSIEYSHLGSVKRISGDTGVVLPSRAADLKAGDSGADLLQLFGDILLAHGTETLKVTRNDAVYHGTNSSKRGVRLSQEIDGIPVINSFIGINYDEVMRRVSRFVASFMPDRGLLRTPKLSAQQAEQIAGGEIVEPTYLGYYVPCCGPRPPKLVWAISIWIPTRHEMVYVDAVTGLLLARVNMSTS
jgi:hypothetical protein